MTPRRLSGDRRLSRYVILTRRHGREVLYDTVGGTVLPATVREADLGEAGMLAGQESTTLWSRLTRTRRELALTLLVTWECNLRCTHCSVRDKLRREDPNRIPADSLNAFVRDYQRAHPASDRLSVSLLGGEPLLQPASCEELIRATRGLFSHERFSITTNLAPMLERPHLEVLSQLDEIIVSIDGLEEAHNEQRKAYRDSFNPFQRTVANLGRLQEAGLIGRVNVQGAIRDDFADEDHFNRFHGTLVRMGVPYDQIRFDTVHPAERGLGVQQSYLDSLRYPLLRREPCCKFRGGSSLIVASDGQVYSDFYTWERLGHLEDGPETIARAQREITHRTMPALKDPECLECPVIGFCWGGCVNGHLVVGDRPSAYCGQQALIERVKGLAESGELIEAEENRGAVGTAAHDPRLDVAAAPGSSNRGPRQS
jgi:radical SAM protein with 4Fe4S-binding SPASM domain